MACLNPSDGVSPSITPPTEIEKTSMEPWLEQTQLPTEESPEWETALPSTVSPLRLASPERPTSRVMSSLVLERPVLPSSDSEGSAARTLNWLAETPALTSSTAESLAGSCLPGAKRVCAPRVCMQRLGCDCELFFLDRDGIWKCYCFAQ